MHGNAWNVYGSRIANGLHIQQHIRVCWHLGLLTPGLKAEGFMISSMVSSSVCGECTFRIYKERATGLFGEDQTGLKILFLSSLVPGLRVSMQLS